MPVALSVEPEARPYLAAGVATRLRRRARAALQATGLRHAHLSILLTDDPALHALNRRYRKIDRATDVLSFAQTEGVAVPDTQLLGDIVISVQTAARRRKRGLEGELFHLLVHGLCHLMGHDHATPAQARRMFALEREIARAVHE